jgi:EpsI family protein
MLSAWFAPGLLGGGVLALLWQLVEFWGIEPAYGDRFLILLASGWLVYRLQSRWVSLSVNPTWLGLFPLLLGAIAAPPVWNLVAQVGTRTILIWWYALALLMLIAGYLLLRFSWSHLKLLLFPLLFSLFALPLPQRVHDTIQGQLQEKTTILAAKTLSLLGVSVERQGFQLHLPSGDLEVVEACSGIRSVTALLAIAALVAYLRGFRLSHGILFFGLAFPIIALGNVVRIVTTGLLQEGFGIAFVQGFIHDLLGILVILVGLGVIVTTSRIFPSAPKSVSGTLTAKNENCVKSRNRLRERLTECVLSLCSIASALCYFQASVNHFQEQETVRLEAVPLKLTQWTGTELKIPEAVRLQLAPEKVIRRHYRTELGQEAEVWVLYWSSTKSMRGYHHPELCWPNHGWRLEGQESTLMSLTDGASFPLTVRRFKQKNREQMVIYWNQEGSRIWSREDESKLQQIDTVGLIRERLFQSRPPEEGRLGFLIAAELGGNRNYSARMVLGLSQELAEKVYELCPWAKPGKENGVP